MEKTNTRLVVSNGQYETAAEVISVQHTTKRGLQWHITRLRNKHSIYGDNWAGEILARVAIASDNDKWGDNSIIGGQWCSPANGWIGE